MAAVITFAVQDSTTSSTWAALSTSLRFKNSDDNVQTATDNPLVRPPSGTNYSFIKSLRVSITTLPATALLALKVKASTADIQIGGSSGGLTLRYNFRTTASAFTRTAAAIPGVVGQLGTTDVDWIYGRAAGSSSGGTVVANHVTGTNILGFWGQTSGADTGSDQLLLGLDIASSPATGGSITSFNLTATYNEI